MNLNFIEYGPENTDRPCLVILHGLFGSAKNWTAICKQLAASYRIIAVDMPNHGGSPWTDDVAYSSMADNVAAFLQAERLTGCTLMGHSMGGKTAMTLALSKPDLIDSLIILDIAPVSYAHDATNGGYIEAMEAVDLTSLANRTEADAQLAEYVDDPALRGFFLLNLVRHGEGFKWRINLEGLKNGLGQLHDFTAAREGNIFKKSTLFLDGENSGYIAGKHHGEINRLFPASEIITIPGAGHWAHADKPGEVIAAISKFLSA